MKSWKKLKKLDNVEKLLKIDFESKPVYGDDDKHIKAKIQIYICMIAGSMITNFHDKNSQGKSTMLVFINNNARFCY